MPTECQPAHHINEYFGGYDQNYILEGMIKTISHGLNRKYPKPTKNLYNPPRRNSPNIELPYIDPI